MTQWMRLCVGALKEFLDKVGGPLRRPTDHAGANSNGDTPPEIMCWHTWHTESGRCCASLILPAQPESLS